MIRSSVRKKILDQLSRLDTERQNQVLEFARSLAIMRPRGVPGKDLLPYAGTIEADDLMAMSQAIEEACEKVNLNEW